MSEFKPLNMYAIKNDSNIIADISIYIDGEIIHNETIVKNKNAFENNHDILGRNVLTLEEI